MSVGRAEYVRVLGSRRIQTWYLSHEGNADEIVHSPSLPSESPATTSGEESEHTAVIAASMAPPPPPPPSPPVGRRNHLTAGGVLPPPPLSRNPTGPVSHDRLQEDLGIGMEAQAIDPSEYPTAILGEFEVVLCTTGVDNPEDVDTTDLFIGCCRCLPETGQRAKQVASPAIVVATGKFSQPPLVPIPGGGNMSRDASWVTTKTTRRDEERCCVKRKLSVRKCLPGSILGGVGKQAKVRR